MTSSQQQQACNEIVAFLHGLKPDLRVFMKDVYPMPRTLKEAAKQASEAAQILYAEGSTTESSVECHSSSSSSAEDHEACDDECESDYSITSESSVECHSSSADSEAVTMSDFVSEDDSVSDSDNDDDNDDDSDMSSAESCVGSDYIESQSESDGDEADTCDNCGSEITCAIQTPRRFKCYGCHATGHKVKDCPMAEIKCRR